jgi:hypothetical protein
MGGNSNYIMMVYVIVVDDDYNYNLHTFIDNST